MNDLLTLIIVGALAGAAASSVMGLRKRRTGSQLGLWLRDTIIGIIGAVIGALLFDLLNIGLPAVLETTISLASIIIAFVGAIIVIFVARLINRA